MFGRYAVLVSAVKDAHATAFTMENAFQQALAMKGKCENSSLHISDTITNTWETNFNIKSSSTASRKLIKYLVNV